jgi:hypothetical protein
MTVAILTLLLIWLGIGAIFRAIALAVRIAILVALATALAHEVDLGDQGAPRMIPVYAVPDYRLNPYSAL